MSNSRGKKGVNVISFATNSRGQIDVTKSLFMPGLSDEYKDQFMNITVGNYEIKKESEKIVRITEQGTILSNITTEKYNKLLKEKKEKSEKISR